VSSTSRIAPPVPPSPESDNAVLAAVLSRSETDVAFRKRLIAEPHEAILAEFGVRIPAQLRIRFMERDPDVDALVVLPDLRVPVEELSDKDLEHVTGGARAHNARLAWKGAIDSHTSHHL
jgi:hypothetical protein